MKTESSQTKLHASRERLKALTEAVKPLVEASEFPSINEALIAQYRNEEHQTFKTFGAWRKDGFAVRKNEKAFLVWAKPKEVLAPSENENTEERYRYFPTSYVFSNAQVIPLELKKELMKKHANPKHTLSEKKDLESRTSSVAVKTKTSPDEQELQVIAENKVDEGKRIENENAVKELEDIREKSNGKTKENELER